MLGIHNQPSAAYNSVPFKGVSSDLKYDIERERDEKLDQFSKDQADWNELADSLEKSDSKIAKKGSKIVRFGATLLGLAATFIGAKYGSKVAIETVKSLSKSGTGKTVVDAVKTMKEPVSKTFGAVKKGVTQVVERPEVKKVVENLKNSKTGQTIIKTLESEQFAKVMEPIKKTIDSMKNIKINGSKVQSIIENTMAATTTGSVIVDNLAGRNDEKSATELASGV